MLSGSSDKNKKNKTHRNISESTTDLRFEDSQEIGSDGAKHPDLIGVVDLISALSMNDLDESSPVGTSTKSKVTHEDSQDEFSLEEAIFDQSYPTSTQMISAAPTLPSVKKEEEAVILALSRKGFSSFLPEYSRFFLTMLDETVGPIKALLKKKTEKKKTSIDTRTRAIRKLKKVASNSLGNISANPKLVFEQTPFSNDVAKAFLSKLLLNQKIVKLLYEDMLFKAKADFPKRYIENNDIENVFKEYNQLIQRYRLDGKFYISSPKEKSLTAEEQEAFLSKMEKVESIVNSNFQSELSKIKQQKNAFTSDEVSAYNALVLKYELDQELQLILKTKQEKLYANIDIIAHLLKDNIVAVNEFTKLKERDEEFSNKILENQGDPRCITFVPCEVEYIDGKKKFITLVGISGAVSSADEDNTLYQIHAAMKQFCDEFEYEGMQFVYPEHATRKFDWLLYETNRALSEKEEPLPVESTALPSKPTQACAEKKVISELAKQLIGKREHQVAHIRVLAETNVHFPYQQAWKHPKTVKPQHMSIMEESEADTIIAEIKRLKSDLINIPQHKKEMIAKVVELLNELANLFNQKEEPEQANFATYLCTNHMPVKELIAQSLEKWHNSNEGQFNASIELLKAVQATMQDCVCKYIKSHMDTVLEKHEKFPRAYLKYLSKENKIEIPSELADEIELIRELAQKLQTIPLKDLIGKLLKDESKNIDKKIQQLQKKLEAMPKEAREIGFYLYSPIRVIQAESTANDESEGAEFFYRFSYRDACEQCQKQKLSYISVLLHGADIDLDSLLVSQPQPDVVGSQLEACNSPVYTPLKQCRAQASTSMSNVLKLSHERCQFKAEKVGVS